MEEIDINNIVNVGEIPKDENEYLEMCNDFKKRIEEKNKEIYELKKTLIKVYGILEITEEFEDISMIHILQEALEKVMEKYCNLSLP